MKNIVTERLAANGLVIIISLMMIFHLLILFGIIPFDIIWGGRISTPSQMRSFELLSIVINILMLAVAAIKAKLIRVNVRSSLINVSLWAMAVLFLLNTIGNITSLSAFEKWVFAPLTMILSLFCFRLALTGKKHKEPEAVSI